MLVWARNTEDKTHLDIPGKRQGSRFLFQSRLPSAIKLSPHLLRHFQERSLRQNKYVSAKSITSLSGLPSTSSKLSDCAPSPLALNLFQGGSPPSR